MEVGIIAVGRMKSGPEQKLFDTYLERTRKAGRSLGIKDVTIRELAESRAQTTQLRKKDEAVAINELAAGSYLVSLDEHGKDMASKEFAALISRQADEGCRKIIFAIGGPDGHGQEVLSASQLTLRMGKMTWPHQIVRILLAEQLYRATTILSGHPYHRS